MTLAEQLITDLDTFLDADEFAVAVTYTPTGKTAKTIYGIFDAPYEEFSPIEGAMAVQPPSVLLKSSDVSALKNNEPMVIGGVSYRVAGSGEPDGTGMTRVRLVK